MLAAPELDGDGQPPAALEGLIGSQRALILRRLDRPLPAGKIAEALFAVPSAASHHITILERAGLVARERRGRRVLGRRTARGTELLGLYDESRHFRDPRDGNLITAGSSTRAERPRA